MFGHFPLRVEFRIKLKKTKNQTFKKQSIKSKKNEVARDLAAWKWVPVNMRICGAQKIIG